MVNLESKRRNVEIFKVVTVILELKTKKWKFNKGIREIFLEVKSRLTRARILR